jgi:hypothetical protein
MAHLGKATKLHGDCTNASNDLASGDWITLVDVSEQSISTNYGCSFTTTI